MNKIIVLSIDTHLVGSGSFWWLIIGLGMSLMATIHKDSIWWLQFFLTRSRCQLVAY